jgi:hypothetical protein
MKLTDKQEEFLRTLETTVLIQCRGRAYVGGPTATILTAPSCCALGVAYKLAKSNNIVEVAAIYGLSESGIDHIIYLNDEEKLSFTGIAARIRQNPERYFRQ